MCRNVLGIVHVKFPDASQNTVLDGCDIELCQILLHVLKNCMLRPCKQIINAVVQTIHDLCSSYPKDILKYPLYQSMPGFLLPCQKTSLQDIAPLSEQPMHADNRYSQE
jgi:hypothetical protein